MGSPGSITDTNSRALILFDGICNLCNGSVQFIIRHDPAAKFSFASLQSPAAKRLLNHFKLPSEDIYSILLIKNGILFDRSDALLEIAKDLNGAWRVLRIFQFLPKGLRDSLYKLVAKNRYKIFGKQEFCLIPTKDLRARFID
jgi:predicted DCC family thiol-disulfide oxidoreductase YuxK